MNLKDTFLSALATPPNLSPAFTHTVFLGTLRETADTLPDQLISILSAGNIHAAPPYAFDLHPLSCYLLLYTRSGMGKLSLRNETYTLVPGTLLFLHCTERFRIDIAADDWSYQVCFLAGTPLSYFYEMLSKQSTETSSSRVPLLPIPFYSESDLKLQKLVSGSSLLSLREQLEESILCQALLTDCMFPVTEDTKAANPIPAYLHQVKTLFDHSFQEYYTLDDLGIRFGVNKYRLCREFHTAFLDSPLQYLNKRRIHIARHLLLTTDYKIHEVGSMVGIDNTNHFISLFKRYTDMTPSAYKQRMT